jgi:hypothetical protein
MATSFSGGRSWSNDTQINGHQAMRNYWELNEIMEKKKCGKLNTTRQIGCCNATRHSGGILINSIVVNIVGNAK